MSTCCRATLLLLPQSQQIQVTRIVSSPLAILPWLSPGPWASSEITRRPGWPWPSLSDPGDQPQTRGQLSPESSRSRTAGSWSRRRAAGTSSPSAASSQTSADVRRWPWGGGGRAQCPCHKLPDGGVRSVIILGYIDTPSMIWHEVWRRHHRSLFRYISLGTDTFSASLVQTPLVTSLYLVSVTWLSLSNLLTLNINHW